jgi:uncharacterized protein (TIGR00369 family)
MLRRLVSTLAAPGSTATSSLVAIADQAKFAKLVHLSDSALRQLPAHQRIVLNDHVAAASGAPTHVEVSESEVRVEFQLATSPVFRRFAAAFLSVHGESARFGPRSGQVALHGADLLIPSRVENRTAWGAGATVVFERKRFQRSLTPTAALPPSRAYSTGAEERKRFQRSLTPTAALPYSTGAEGLSDAELRSFLLSAFPQVAGEVELIGTAEDGVLQVRLVTQAHHLRPGETVMGPMLFLLADVAVYMAILSRIGRVPLAVTTSASIDFLRKPTAGRDLIASARLLKLGRQLAVGDVLIAPAGAAAEPVARATLTYSIPPRRSFSTRAAAPDASKLPLQWFLLCRSLDADAVAAPWFEKLENAYSEDGRFYHTLDHIAAMLQLYSFSGGGAKSTELAIWFHDVVYDSKRGDNEERSGDVFGEFAREARLEPAVVVRTQQLIAATKTHKLPAELAKDTDAALFLDIDLSVLGAAPDVYDSYAHAIRKEYGWVPDEQFREGRAKVLRALTAKQIYKTPSFQQAFEALARSNIERELASLFL